jgi:hypothetical protein
VSIGSLVWIADGASQAGLAFDESILDMYRQADNFCADFPKKERTIGDFLLTVVGTQDRQGVKSFDEISPGARKRWKERADYRPPALTHFAKALEQ